MRTLPTRSGLAVARAASKAAEVAEKRLPAKVAKKVRAGRARWHALRSGIKI
jgi:hypothetical protein